jgi:hypothetical protein
MYCPRCKYTYSDQLDICPRCGADWQEVRQRLELDWLGLGTQNWLGEHTGPWDSKSTERANLGSGPRSAGQEIVAEDLQACLEDQDQGSTARQSAQDQKATSPLEPEIELEIEDL